MEETNKTIIVTYDDISRMKEFCTDKDVVVTRDFMDWYVNDNAFFTKKGMLIVEDMLSQSNKKFTIGFDFNNPDYPEFSLYNYDSQKEICKYYFIKEDNLSMKDITVKIKWFDKKEFTNQDNAFSSGPINAEISKILVQCNRMKANKHTSKNELLSQKNFLEKQLDVISLKIRKLMTEQGVYFTYATMYYFAKNKATEVTGMPKTQLLENGIGKQITSFYKYTGYVNINDAKIYKPVIKKDKNEPVREYGRHIEKWSVRGHYRRVNGKTIWIEPFEKGEGELEKRIYGTEKESELNLVPKIFEVTKTVYEDSQPSPNIEVTSTIDDNKITEPQPVIETPLVREETIKEPAEKPVKLLQKLTDAWDKIISFFASLKI